MRWMISGFLWMVWLGPAAADPAQCGEPVAQYSVRFAGEDRFVIDAEFAAPSQRWDLAHFPTPERPEAQAASVRDLEAFSASGDAVEILYVGEGGWETTAVGGASRLRYTLIADHDQVDWNIGAPGKDEVAAHFDASYVFAGHAFFLLDWDMPRCAVDLSFDLPAGWLVTAPWPEHGEGYRIADSWALGQNMFAMGLDQPQETRTGGLSLSWLMDSRLDTIRPRAVEILDVVPGAYTEFWGEAPGSAYTIFFMSDYMSDGGAFWDSFALRIALPLSAADEISWSHTLGHEVMHLWNSLGKADGENVPDLEWVNEGFTDYLTLKLMSQAGLIEPEMVEQRLANLVRRYVLAGRFSPGVSLREAGHDKSAHWQTVYGGGGLVALLLDAELSRTEPQAFGAALRAMRAEQGEGYSYERFLETLDRLTENRASELVAWIDGRPSNSELVVRFAAAGLDLSLFGFDEAYVRFPACGDARCPPPYLAPGGRP